MAKLQCLYCGIRLDRASAQVRLKHMTGKKHQKSVSDYWEGVAQKINASKDAGNFLDQSVELAQSWALPGLDPRADELLDTAKVPAPANIPSTTYPRQYLG